MQKFRSNIVPRNHPQGNKKVPTHRKLQSFPSDSVSCGSRVEDEDQNSFKLGWRSSKQYYGTPIKELLAEEMSREIESKRRGPNVVARLMGIDGHPLNLPANKQHTGSSENHLTRMPQAGDTRSRGTLFDSRSSRISSKDRLEFKDVFEVSEIPKIESIRYSMQGSVDLDIIDDEMSFIEQKFRDAKCHATYQDLQSLQNSHATLEFLHSNDDLMLKYFRRPDSMYKKHINDMQAAPLQSHSGHTQARKASDAEKYEHIDFRWKIDRESKRLNCNRSHQKHHNGYPCQSDRRHGRRNSSKSLKLLFKGRQSRHKHDALLARIVILKPNLGKVQNATTAVSSPSASHGFQSERGKITEFSDVRFRDIQLDQGTNIPETAWHSRQNSLESREIAKEITSQMKKGLNNGLINFSSSRFRGYAWDDSSCSSSGNEDPDESEVTDLAFGNSFDIINARQPSSRSSESSVSREAKKRLSERWKLAHKSQHGQSICQSSTLAEMLAKETKVSTSDSLSCGEGYHDKFVSKGKPSKWVEPSGISSRDGWKDGCIGSLPRSKSLHSWSTASGSVRAVLHHEACHDDRLMLPKHMLKLERKKVAKLLDQRQCINIRSSRSSRKKSWLSDSSNEEGEVSSPELLTIQNKVKINIDYGSPKEEVLLTETLAEILGDTSSVAESRVDFTNENVAEPSQSSNEVLPESSSPVLIKGDINAVGGNNLMPEELSVDSYIGSSVSLQQPVTGLESSCCKDADQPSPVSVLEPSFTDDLSSSCSECFESLSVELQGLRMQLKLLKSESEECVEGTMQTSSDEDGGEASTVISENNGSHRTEHCWESSYVTDVLCESGIYEAHPDTFSDAWPPLESPVSISVFDELEKRYSDCTTCSRSERRLLFDSINSGIVNILEQFMYTLPWIIPAAPNSGSKLIKNGVQDYLYRMVGSQGISKDTALGKLLVSESKWLKLRNHIDVIGREVESLLFDDILSELVCSMFIDVL